MARVWAVTPLTSPLCLGAGKLFLACWGVPGSVLLVREGLRGGSGALRPAAPMAGQPGVWSLAVPRALTSAWE